MWKAYSHKVTVQRADTWARFRRLQVVLDGVVIAKLWRRKSVDIVVAADAPGALILKMDWVESDPIDLWAMREGSVLRILDNAELRKTDMGLNVLPFNYEILCKDG